MPGRCGTFLYWEKKLAMIPIRPGPLAIGSFSHVGGVSQTKAKIAITMRSYCHVARSNVQKSACQIMRNGRVKISKNVMSTVSVRLNEVLSR